MSAMAPDTKTLIAINTGQCGSDTLLNNKALQRKSMKTESATLVAKALALPNCLISLITSPSF
jgi:hypothetical protein